MTFRSLFEKFFPDERVCTVNDVNYRELIQSGIKAVLFDLDNTIAKWGDEDLPEEVVDLFNRLTDMGLKVGILSNSRRNKVDSLLADLPFPHVFNANKPGKKGFRSLLAELDVEPESAAMIGDQLLTDVLGANRMNMYTIRVDPIDPEKEYTFTRINRMGEKILLLLRDLYRYFARFKDWA